MPQHRLGPIEIAGLKVGARVLGALPDGVGQFRIAQRYVRQRRPAPGHVVRQRMRNGTVMELDLADRTQSLAFLTRRYEPAFVDYIASRIPASGLFVDVGANVGLISFAVARRSPHARVLAFEPFAPNVSSWKRNRDLNRACRAEVEACAVGDRVGTASFQSSEDSGWGHVSGDGDLAVSMTTLDRYCEDHQIPRIDVLKIDAEGGEPAVLSGAQGLLGRGEIDTVVCELNDFHLDRVGSSRAEIEALLTQHGFTRRSLAGGRRGLAGMLRPSAPDSEAAFERVADCLR